MRAKIYTKQNCIYCIRAKQIFADRDMEYEEIEIGKDITLSDFQTILPNAKTVPQIYLQESGGMFYVGGHDDLVEFLEDYDNNQSE